MSEAALETRRKTLASCSLFVASFLRWDLAAFELRLAPAVLYSLLSLLTQAHPLPGDAPRPSANPLSLTAHTLYHLWVVRFAVSRDSATPTRNSRGNGGVTEVNCASPDQIYTLVG